MALAYIFWHLKVRQLLDFVEPNYFLKGRGKTQEAPHSYNIHKDLSQSYKSSNCSGEDTFQTAQVPASCGASFTDAAFLSRYLCWSGLLVTELPLVTHVSVRNLNKYSPFMLDSAGVCFWSVVGGLPGVDRHLSTLQKVSPTQHTDSAF